MRLYIVLGVISFLSATTGASAQKAEIHFWMMKSITSSGVIELDHHTEALQVSLPEPDMVVDKATVLRKSIEQNRDVVAHPDSFKQRIAAAWSMYPLRIEQRNTGGDIRNSLAMVSARELGGQRIAQMGLVRICRNFFLAPIPCRY